MDTRKVTVQFDTSVIVTPVARAYIELVKVLAENRALSSDDLERLAARVPGLSVEEGW